MFLKRLFGRLRGALGIAILWGTAWFVAGLAIVTVAAWTGALPWDLILGMAARLGRIGFFTGGAFSGLLTYAYRDRSLSEINTVRFALGGAALAALLSRGMAAMAGLFGGVTAAASIKLAKRASDPLVPGDSPRVLDQSVESLALADEASNTRSQ